MRNLSKLKTLLSSLYANRKTGISLHNSAVLGAINFFKRHLVRHVCLNLIALK